MNTEQNIRTKIEKAKKLLKATKKSPVKKLHCMALLEG